MKYGKEEWYQSKSYHLLREQCIEHCFFHCVLCGGPAEVMHHNNYEHSYGEETIADVVMLCDKCHAAYHHKERSFMKLENVSYFADPSDVVPSKHYLVKIINSVHEPDMERIKLVVEIQMPAYKDEGYLWYLNYGDCYNKKFNRNIRCIAVANEDTPECLFKSVQRSTGSCLVGKKCMVSFSERKSGYDKPLVARGETE